MTTTTSRPHSLRQSLLRLAALTFLTAAAAPAAETAARKNPPTAPAAAAGPAKSPGWLNERLREANPAFNEWDFGISLRFRYEHFEDAGPYPSNDFLRGLENDNGFFLFRQKVHLGWTPEKWLKFHVQGRGAQAESDIREPSPGQDGFDLHQAYIELGGTESFPLSLKAGRQEMLYGDQRFIGIADWNNTGRSFDAVRLRWQPDKKTWIDLFTGRVVIPRDDYFNESNDEDQFSGLYLSTQELWDKAETQAFFLARNVDAGSPNAIAPGVGGPGERDVYTWGLRLKSLPEAFGAWDFLFEGAGQFGTVVSSGRDADLRSFALTGTAGYTLAELAMKPRLSLGYDYASGDSSARDGRHETFEPLFGTNHSFYGVQDLVGLRNISSPRIALSVKPVKNLTLGAEWLVFWLADTADSFYPESGSARSGNGYGRNPSLSSFAGSELDLTAKYQLNSVTELQAGYSHFFAGDYIKESAARSPSSGGATDADWVYLQVSLTF